MRRARAFARRAATVAAVAAFVAAALAFPAPAAAQAPTTPRLVVIGLPLAEARAVAARHGAAVGLGVYPSSRRVFDFFSRIGVGAPRDPGSGDGSPGALYRSLRAIGLSIGIGISPAPGSIAGVGVIGAFAEQAEAATLGLRRIPRRFAAPPLPPSVAQALLSDVAVLVLASAAEADGAIASARGATVFVFGAGDRTPVLVADLARRGLLGEGISRRPGIVTPADVAVTMLAALGYDGTRGPEAFAGRPLAAAPRPAALAEVARLGERLERDAPQGVRLAFALGALVILGVPGALWALRAGARTGAVRIAQAIAFAPAGYLASLYVQSSSVWVRGLPIALFASAGGLWRPSERRRAPAVVLLATAAAIAVLSVLSWTNPDGEPALSLWGNPLISWRFFGLRNQLVAFLAGGAIGGAALAGLRRGALVGVAIAAGIVAAAPRLGANYVGVLWLAGGATVAAFAWEDGVLRLRHLVWGALVGLAAFGVALSADAGAPVTHGGRAVEQIQSGGLSAARELVSARIRLNIDSIRGFPGGFALAGLTAAVMAGLLVWAARSGAFGRFGGAATPRGRAAIAGLAAASLAALATEDTGFFTAALLAFYALFALVLECSGARPPPAAVETDEPDDVEGLQQEAEPG